VLTIAARQAAGMLRGRSFWVLTALGAALVAVGAYRVIVPAGNGGQVAAVTAGCLLLVCPFVISRVEQLTVGASGLQMLLSREAADQGASKAAPSQRAGPGDRPTGGTAPRSDDAPAPRRRRSAAALDRDQACQPTKHPVRQGKELRIQAELRASTGDRRISMHYRSFQSR
jgi:hypothetical protein